MKAQFEEKEKLAEEMARRVKELEAENGLLNTDLEAAETKYV